MQNSPHHLSLGKIFNTSLFKSFLSQKLGIWSLKIYLQSSYLCDSYCLQTLHKGRKQTNKWSFSSQSLHVPIWLYLRRLWWKNQENDILVSNKDTLNQWEQQSHRIDNCYYYLTGLMTAIIISQNCCENKMSSFIQST